MSRRKSNPILALAIPAIIANITTPLLSLVDVAIVGRLGSAAYVAAIAVGGTMFNLLYWLLGFLRTGTSGLTAQAEGRGSDSEAAVVLCRSLILAAGFSLLFIALQVPIGKLLLNAIDPDEFTAREAWRYFSILIWGAPAALGQFAMTGWLIGRQDTKATMWVSLLINVVNIVSSITLVWGLNMGMAGVACGTLIAQWTGFIAAAIYSLRKYSIPVPCLKELLDRKGFKRFFLLNADIFLRTLCLIAVTLWFTRAGAARGATILAVNTLMMQFFTIFSYFMDGFAYAAEALCGKAYGSRDYRGLTVTVRSLMRYGAGVAAIFTIIYAVGDELLLKLLTSDLSVLSAAEEYRLWIVTIPFAGFMAFTWDGVFIGTTLTRLMLASIAVATLFFFMTWWALTPSLGNHAVWLAFIGYLLIRGLVQYWLWRRFVKHLIL